MEEGRRQGTGVLAQIWGTLCNTHSLTLHTIHPHSHCHDVLYYPASNSAQCSAD